VSQPCLHEHDWGVMEEWRKENGEKLDLILAQTIKTNGRLRALEHWRTVLTTAVVTLLVTRAGEVGEWVQMIKAAL
jgi:hypothetical protein